MEPVPVGVRFLRGGWFAAEDVVCDAPWVIEEWPRGSGHYIDRFDDETGLPEAVRLERAR